MWNCASWKLEEILLKTFLHSGGNERKIRFSVNRLATSYQIENTVNCRSYLAVSDQVGRRTSSCNERLTSFCLNKQISICLMEIYRAQWNQGWQSAQPFIASFYKTVGRDKKICVEHLSICVVCLRGRKWREAGEDCIMKNFITCTLHQILGWSSRGGWDGRGM